MLTNTPKYVYTAEELAAFLGVSKSSVYVLMRSEGFPLLRIGKRLLVPRDKLEIWIDQQTKSIK